MRPSLRLLVVLLAVGAGAGRAPLLDAQVRPVYDRGAAGLTHALERLQTTASALHTGAHPDDEDSAFLARTARGDHARVAYLSLTRGEGGQNFIGTELFEALGVIRTEELLQARALDGAEQFFTRAIDYGFSKTRAEAAAMWNEREVLADMVRVIRLFRPLVVTSRFSGTAADGHGQHQLAGHLTPLAFRAAADPREFPEQLAEGLRPWQAKQLFLSVRRPSGDGLIEVDTGVFDWAIGRSYAEIAAEGRSQHKSQQMGTIEPLGDASSYLRPVETGGPVAAPDSIFAGIDVTVPGLAALAGLPGGALQSELRLMADSARTALDDYTPLDPARIVPPLAAGLRATRAARAALDSIAAPPDARAEADFLLSFKEQEFTDALARAAGVVVDALADRETVAAGSSLGVSVRTYFPDPGAVRVVDAGLTMPGDWNAVRLPEGADEIRGAGDARHAQAFTVAVPVDAPATQPYFLDTPREGARYRWTEDDPRALPFAAGPLTAWVTAEAGGVSFTVRKRVDYRFADPVRGEIRRNVNVVPAVTVGVDSRLLIVPLGAEPSRHRIVVTATSHTPQRSLPTTVRLRLPSGWTSTPPEATFTLASNGDRTSTAFEITAPAGRVSGGVEIAAEAVAGGATFSRDVQTIAYPHIDTHRVYRPASVTAQVIDLQVAPVRVGYVMGSGDQVPDALRRMGVDVTLVEDETLATGDLSVFDTIVVGVRASEARPDFPAEHARLMEYVTRGGTLIVQYQQTDYLARNLPPYPAVPPPGTGNSRVTDETAPVTLLDPRHPVFTFPNTIAAADFDGWVQERNLYAFPVVDPRYTPLLETFDPGEPPQRGGQVYAEIGKGRYVYTAYAWFRQLPAGVPGAYRQFANLISLPHAPR